MHTVSYTHLDVYKRQAITNATGNGIDAELARLECALTDGLRLIQVRDKTLPSSTRLQLAKGVVTLASRHADARVLINDDEALAHEVGASGLHLSAGRLKQIKRRPSFAWVAASCHSTEELQCATSLGLDFVVLGPVSPTATHPGAKGMGWGEFASLIEQSPLPVFALGGMRTDMLEMAWEFGAHGIAQMRGWGQ